MKTLKIVVLILLLMTLTVSVFSPVGASYVSLWQGAGNTVPMIYLEDSPLVMENAKITFDIPSFPMKKLEEPNYDYNSSVTAEYTLYNPTEEALTVEAWLPVWDKGEYYQEWNMERAPEVPYSITANGVELSYDVRPVAVPGTRNLLSGDDFGYGSRELMKDDFFSPDLKVTVYTYHLKSAITRLDGDEIRYIGFEVPEVPEGTKVAFPLMYHYGSAFDYATEEEATVFATEIYSFSWMGAPDGDLSLRVYFLGEDPGEAPVPRVFLKWNEEHSYFSDELLSETYLKEYTVEEMTLLELADSLKPEDADFTQVQWYNAMVSKMRWDSRENPEGILTLDQIYLTRDMQEEVWNQQGSSMDFYTEPNRYYLIYVENESYGLKNSMMDCYVYSLTIGPGERLIHQVQAPLYPTIHHIDSAEYRYLFLLTPANTWGKVESVDIEIRTPHRLSYSNLPGLARQGDLFTLTMEGNPETELYFTLEEGYDGGNTATEVPTESPTQAPARESVQAADPVEKKNIMPWIFGSVAVLSAVAAAFFVVRHLKNRTEP